MEGQKCCRRQKRRSVVEGRRGKRGREGVVFIKYVRRFNIANRNHGRFKTNDMKYPF